jgi:drug/metabolite transporter (DMT)-like permease
VFYFSVTSSLLSLVTLPFGWVVPGPADAALLVLSGLLGGVGQIMMTAAYRNASAATIAPLEYVSIIWGLILGYFLFAEIPHRSVVFGGAIVVAAGIVIILRERKLGMQRARQRRATGS